MHQVLRHHTLSFGSSDPGHCSVASTIRITDGQNSSAMFSIEVSSIGLSISVLEAAV